MKKIYLYISLIIILISLFLAPFEEVFLTVNEELFVIISFLIFADLLGNTILTAIANAADSKILSISTRLSNLLIQKFVSLTDLYISLSTLLKLINFRLRLIKQFRLSTRNMLSLRSIDMFYFFIQLIFHEYKLRYYFINLRLIALLSSNDALTTLIEDVAINNKKSDKKDSGAISANLKEVKAFKRKAAKKNYYFLLEQVTKLQSFST
jgi:hypothetical protein